MEANTNTPSSQGPEGTPELTALMGQRSATYGLLARLYRSEVDEALLDELRHVRLPASTGNRDLDAAHRTLARYLGGTWENTLTELAVDYVRVFIGHGVDAYSAAYPYESVYTSPKRLLMQDARNEVLALFRSEGLDKRESWREGEDHLALELEFMQTLADRTTRALEAGDEDGAVRLLTAQRNFLEEHLRTWVPLLTHDMRTFAQTGLYQALAQLTDGFIETEHELLDDLLGEDEA